MRLKAYSVTDRTDCSFSTVVFAESSGKAKAICYQSDMFEDVEWTDLWAKRVPALDDAYRGRKEMDWCDDRDRLRMVRDADFQCSPEVDIDYDECKTCPGFLYCGRVEGWRDENNGRESLRDMPT